jgi:hypothetical protein
MDMDMDITMGEKKKQLPKQSRIVGKSSIVPYV